jgi:glycosidase
VDVIDLNYEIPALRTGMIKAMKHWVKNFDIDGFRCDMARTVPVDFWIEARASVIPKNVCSGWLNARY